MFFYGVEEKVYEIRNEDVVWSSLREFIKVFGIKKIHFDEVKIRFKTSEEKMKKILSSFGLDNKEPSMFLSKSLPLDQYSRFKDEVGNLSIYPFLCREYGQNLIDHLTKKYDINWSFINSLSIDEKLKINRRL